MSDLPYSHIHKLSRAQEHLDSLSQELNAFLQPYCYEIANEYDVEAPHQGLTRVRLTRRVVFKVEPPLLKWGIIVGDCIQNLRSSLDHMVFAISHSRDPNEFKDDRTTEFPICDSPEAFNRSRRRNWPPHHEIRGLPREAQTIIEQFQPYQGGQKSLSNHPLWILREMSNIDKHRSIHITAWSAHALALDITGLAPGVSIHSHQVRPLGVIESGTEIAKIEFSTPDPSEPAMKLQKEFYFTISFGEGTPMAGKQVQDALASLVANVHDITSRLSAFIVD